MKLIILFSFCVGTLAVPMFQSVSVKDDGSYDFSYETGKEGGSHSRTEKRNPDGVVIGKFSYEDPNGAIREISYRADESGYVANGDVSVEGAPKGQFPAVPEFNSDDPVAPEDDKNPNVLKPEDEETPHASEQHHSDEESHHDDIHNLSLEEPSANEPPEAFPEGYFLHKFTGLRRLPEPTKEEPTATSAPTTEASEPQAFPVSVTEDQPPQEAVIASDAANEEHNKINREPTSEMELLMHPRPFQGFHSAQWTSSMFHQPVYVFSYQHPESFGYYYYY
ncbi:uncharacterized protein [Parasteatoda tepidariorum]|nr:uncharacterized protein LOC107436879 [Parasteatoda tepidariorum]